MDEKVCPLMSIPLVKSMNGPVHVTYEEMYYHRCIREECACWNAEKKSCGLVR